MCITILSRKLKTYPSGGNCHLYQTDKGELTATEVCEYIGIRTNSFHQRICKYGLCDPRVVMPPSRGMHSGVEGNDEYRALGNRVRGGIEKIKIGQFEQMIPDRIDPKKGGGKNLTLNLNSAARTCNTVCKRAQLYRKKK